MKQINHNSLLFLILASLLLTGCYKENSNIDITSNIWEVVKMKKQAESSYTKANASYILEFLSDGSFKLNLDVNNCIGQYQLLGNGGVNVDEIPCTKICCDSEFADDMIQLFPKMTTYYGKGQKLIFEGTGEIVLKPI